MTTYKQFKHKEHQLKRAKAKDTVADKFTEAEFRMKMQEIANNGDPLWPFQQCDKKHCSCRYWTID